jgi:hypothetical protein
MHPPDRLPEEISAHECAPDEWIVGPGSGARALHVYRLAPVDWLVSEVGSASEGRGAGLREALLQLAGAVAAAPEWWAAAQDAIDQVASRDRHGG